MDTFVEDFVRGLKVLSLAVALSVALATMAYVLYILPDVVKWCIGVPFAIWMTGALWRE